MGSTEALSRSRCRQRRLDNTKLVHWALMDVLLHLIKRGGDCMGGVAARPWRPLLAVPNVTAHPSTASVPNTIQRAVALRF